MKRAEYRAYIDKIGFNQEAFDTSDPATRVVVIKFLELKGWFVHDPTMENQYSVDLIAYDLMQQEWAIDFEYREIWTGRRFPKFPTKPYTVHMPFRKKKFLRADRFLYLVVNRERVYTLICKGEVIQKHPVTQNDTTRMEKEPFYDVPVERWNLYNLKTGEKA